MAQRMFRGTGWTAAAGGLLLAAGALAGVTGIASAGTHTARVRLSYGCRFPSGSRQAALTVAASFPATAVTGQPVQPSGLRTTVTLPPAVATELSRLGAATVTASDLLVMSVTDAAKHVITARWPGQAGKPAPVPGTGGLTLPIRGRALPVTAGARGTLTFTASSLGLWLALRRAGGAPVSPASLSVACALDPGQRAELAAIGVSAATPASNATPTPVHIRPAGRPASRGGGIPRDCVKRIIHVGTTSPVLGCAYLIGYADVRKLNGAGLIGPGPHGKPPAAFLNIDTYASDIGCVPKEPSAITCLRHHGTIHVYSCTAADLNDHSLRVFPPARVTFLTFGFEPVTAVMQLSETRWPRSHPPTEAKQCYQGFNRQKPVKLSSPIISVFTDLSDSAAAGYPVLNIGTTYLTIHVSHVTVNGVPLNVGPHCGVTRPVRAVLIGRGRNTIPPTGYTLHTGGPLTGSVTIPKFTGCGVSENLDPLLTASISGPANFQLMTQGRLCTPQQSGKPGCPPNVPKPRRHL